MLSETCFGKLYGINQHSRQLKGGRSEGAFAASNGKSSKKQSQRIRKCHFWSTSLAHLGNRLIEQISSGYNFKIKRLLSTNQIQQTCDCIVLKFMNKIITRLAKAMVHLRVFKFIS